LCNECDNSCAYCGFSRQLKEKRVCLTPQEVEEESEVLYAKGFRHILLVSGEKRDKVSIPYLKEVIIRLHQKFESISLEIFPLEEKEYCQMVLAGADGLTLYQEVYNLTAYQRFHPSGPKSDYEARLLTPERAARAGFYRINIGVLLGLSAWLEEAALLGLHAAHLKKSFWRSQIAVSFPRLKSSAADFKPPYPVVDRQLVQMICALRIFQPSLGLVLSTREDQSLRDNLIHLGITQMSAESKTSPGGYSRETPAEEQFKVSDLRRVDEVTAAIHTKGYDPVFKDWDRGYSS
jgi:2-iminoacetate synthase